MAGQADSVEAQQAPEASSSRGVGLAERRKRSLSAFICYARESDSDFRNRLAEALRARGVEPKGDWLLTPGPSYRDQLAALIRESDVFVAVISRLSVASPECREEIEQANLQKKKLLPVQIQDGFDKAALHGALRLPQWTLLRPIDDFEIGIKSLGEAINTDFDLLVVHTWLTQRAADWGAKGRHGSALLSGRDLKEAEIWLSKASTNQLELPNVTPLQADFVSASQRARARRMQSLIAVAAIVVVALGGLTVYAFQQRNEARSQERIATENATKEKVARRAAEHELYLSNVSAASDELAANNVTRVEQLLNEAPTEQRKWEWFYLKNALTHSALLTITESPELVKGLAFSSDHKTLLITRPSKLTLLDSARGKPIQKFNAPQGQTGEFTRAMFSGDGKEVISGDSQGVLTFWDSITATVIRTIRAHTAAITCIALSGDGTRIATASEDRLIKVWDLASGRELLTLSGHTAAVTCIAFSPDNFSLASGAKTLDSRVKIWSLTSGRETLTLPGHWPLNVNSVAFSPDGREVASAGFDRRIRVWDVKTGRMVQELNGHTADVVSVVFSHSGEYIFSASNDQTARAWPVKPGRKSFTLRGHTTAITSMALSADDACLATSSLDGVVKIWDATRAPEAITIRAEEGSKYTAMAFSPDGERIVVAAGPTNALRVINALTGHQEGAWLAGSEKILSVAFSADGQRVASLSANGTVKLWEPTSPREVASFSAGDASASIAFASHGTAIVCAGSGAVVRVFDIAAGKERLQFRSSHEAPGPGVPQNRLVGAVGLSANGARFASCGNFDSQIKVWDAQKGELTRVFDAPMGNLPTSVAFSRDGRFLAVSASSGSEGPSIVSFWDIEKNQQLGSFTASSYVDCLACSPDGTRLASIAVDGNIRVWEADSGREVLRDSAGPLPAGLAFSPNGKRLALAEPEALQIWDAPHTREMLLYRERYAVTGVAFDAGSTRDFPGARLMMIGTGMRMYNVWTGREVRSLGYFHKSNLAVGFCCAFSPDGSRVACGGGNATNFGKITLWDAEGDRKLFDLLGDTNVVVAVAFSPNGQLLGSASHDNTARIWNVTTGKQILSFSGHRDRVNSIAFRPDGKQVATGGHDKTVKIWDPVTGRELLTLSGHTYSVTSVAFRPDGKRLASASRPTDEATNGEVKIWDLETGKQLFALSGFEGGIYSVAFSPDGRMLAAAGVDRNVHVWDAENGRQLLVLRGHEDTIIRLAFSADGKCIASASVDRTVRVWDLSNPSDASNTAASPEASPTPEMAIQPSPTPETATKPSAALGQLPSIVAPVPTPQTRQAQPVDFLIGIDALLTSHDYADLSHYLHETTYYFGKRDATKAWIKNDMENDARTYAWCRTVPDLSTYHEWIDASGNTHQAMNEETWAQERTGRKHHAHCRLEIVRSGSGIIEFHLDVLKGHP